MTIGKARKILGEIGKTYSDSEIEQLINLFLVLSDLAIDSFLSKNNNQKEVKAKI